jgi:hypothetical protein
MTGDSQFRFVGIIFHPFLDATNRDGLSGKRPFLYQKNLLHFIRRSHLEISQESMKSIVADIDNTILGAFAILDEQHSAFKINVTEGTITYAGATYEGTTESTIKQEGKDMTIETTMKKRHVGPCPK